MTIITESVSIRHREDKICFPFHCCIILDFIVGLLKVLCKKAEAAGASIWNVFYLSWKASFIAAITSELLEIVIAPVFLQFCMVHVDANLGSFVCFSDSL